MILGQPCLAARPVYLPYHYMQLLQQCLRQSAGRLPYATTIVRRLHLLQVMY